MILNALQREWDATLADAVSPWSFAPGCLADVLQAIRRHPDVVLLALLRQLREGNQLAGRVVVQTMLPALRRLAATGLDPDVVVAHLWLVAAEYPIERRPASVAANLAMDTRKRAVAELVTREVPGLDADVVPWPAPAPAGPTARDVVERAVALQLVTPATARLLVDVYDAGHPGREVAQRHGLSEPAVRQRCSKAVRRMSGHRLALVA